MLQEIDLDRYRSKIGEEKWCRIRYLQTCLKHRTGVGKPIIIEYYAPVPQNPTKPIKYDFRSMGDELTMLRQKDYVGYCTKQVMKMCYYVQKMYNFEILKIRAEFAMDKNETIWFQYANQIYRRQVPGIKDLEENKKLIAYCNRQHQKILIDQLRDH